MVMVVVGVKETGGDEKRGRDIPMIKLYDIVFLFRRIH